MNFRKKKVGNFVVSVRDTTYHHGKNAVCLSRSEHQAQNEDCMAYKNFENYEKAEGLYKELKNTKKIKQTFHEAFYTHLGSPEEVKERKEQFLKKQEKKQDEDPIDDLIKIKSFEAKKKKPNRTWKKEESL
jgi:hypothetical protein